jgi:hypothetical protein
VQKENEDHLPHLMLSVCLPNILLFGLVVVMTMMMMGWKEG